MDYETIVGIAAVAGSLAAFGVYLQFNGNHSKIKTIPKIKDPSQIKQGFVSPNDLEIICEDLDRDGMLETALKIDNTIYLLKKENDKPKLIEYRL